MTREEEQAIEDVLKQDEGRTYFTSERRHRELLEKLSALTAAVESVESVLNRICSLMPDP